MKTYQKPETVNVSIEGANIMQAAESVASAVGNPDGQQVNENYGMAPRKVI